jgi:hypothetical protein
VNYNDRLLEFPHEECRDDVVSGKKRPSQLICASCFGPAVLLVDGEVEELLPC